jgi:hypothetical protein
VESILPTYTTLEQQCVLELPEARVVYTDARHSRIYITIPCEMGIDPREFYVGDAFAEKWEYTANPNALFVRRGMISSPMNFTHRSPWPGTTVFRFCAPGQWSACADKTAATPHRKTL